MADDVRPRAGDEQEVSSSGLLLSVDPLQGTEGYKLAGDDSDSSDILGGDSDGSDAGGGDSDAGEGEDSDAGEGVDSDSADSAMNPLGLADSAGLDADSSDSSA